MQNEKLSDFFPEIQEQNFLGRFSGYVLGSLSRRLDTWRRVSNRPPQALSRYTSNKYMPKSITKPALRTTIAKIVQKCGYSMMRGDFRMCIFLDPIFPISINKSRIRKKIPGPSLFYLIFLKILGLWFYFKVFYIFFYIFPFWTFLFSKIFGTFGKIRNFS